MPAEKLCEAVKQAIEEAEKRKCADPKCCEVDIQIICLSHGGEYGDSPVKKDMESGGCGYKCNTTENVKCK
ncbi:MAG: hypothetical protein NZM04_08725 [Methylacidiphilales bacterium]|nr:hypothetical protein [Candidatus Methylacidiphilales bacterium]